MKSSLLNNDYSKLFTCNSINREIFRTAENKNVSVDMAHTTCIGRYYRDEELNVEFIELPYHPNPVSIKFIHYFTPNLHSII